MRKLKVRSQKTRVACLGYGFFKKRYFAKKKKRITLVLTLELIGAPPDCYVSVAPEFAESLTYSFFKSLTVIKFHFS